MLFLRVKRDRLVSPPSGKNRAVLDLFFLYTRDRIITPTLKLRFYLFFCLCVHGQTCGETPLPPPRHVGIFFYHIFMP